MGNERPKSILNQITQREIEHLLVLRQQTEEAHVVANKRKAELEAEEGRLIEGLMGGARVEPGSHFLLITTESTGRSVAWRRVVERELGKAFAEMELAKTPSCGRTVLKVLEEVAGVQTNKSRCRHELPRRADEAVCA